MALLVVNVMVYVELPDTAVLLLVTLALVTDVAVVIE